MTHLTQLPNLIIEPMITRALSEDFGNSGDVTARLLVPESATGTLVMRARESGVICLLYTSPSPRDATLSRMPSSA